MSFFALGLVVLAGGSVSLAVGLIRVTGSKLIAGVALQAAPVFAVGVAAVTAHEYKLVPLTVSLGANVAAIGLILGVAALVKPLAAESRLFPSGVPPLIAAALLLMFLARDNELTRTDGGVMVAAFVGLLVAVRGKLAWRAERVGVGLVVVGLGAVGFGAWQTVHALPAAIGALHWNGVPMGLPLVAAGASVPALVAAVWAARRGHADAVMGAVVAACVCHTLLTLGVVSLIKPLPVPERIGMQALPAALVFACLLLPIRATESKVPRWEGAILLAAYVAFAAWQVTSPAK